MTRAALAVAPRAPRSSRRSALTRGAQGERRGSSVADKELMGRFRTKYTRGPAARWLTPRDFLNGVRNGLHNAGLAAGPQPRHCRVQGGPALGLGHLSRCEYADVEIPTVLTAVRLREALAPHLPPGVAIVWARRLPPRAPALTEAIQLLRCRVLNTQWDAGRLAAFRAAERWPLVRVKKGQERTIDLKEFIARAAVEGHGFEYDLRARPEGAPKPHEIAASIFGLPLTEAMLLPAERIGALVFHHGGSGAPAVPLERL